MPKVTNDIEHMTIPQAVQIGLLLIEFELEEPAILPQPMMWRAELLQCRKLLKKLFHEIAPGQQAPIPEKPPKRFKKPVNGLSRK